jgi:general secretion pathway protein H
MTLAAGNCGRARGISLLELLVVLAIIAGAVAMAYPRLGGAGTRSNVQLAAVQLGAQLKATRLAAVQGSRLETLTIDLGAQTFWSSVDRTVRRIGSAVRVADCGALGELDAHRVLVIPFGPDGSARDCLIVLGEPDLAVRLRVDWLTGTVGLAGGPS